MDRVIRKRIRTERHYVTTVRSWGDIKRQLSLQPVIKRSDHIGVAERAHTTRQGVGTRRKMKPRVGSCGTGANGHRTGQRIGTCTIMRHGTDVCRPAEERERGQTRQATESCRRVKRQRWRPVTVINGHSQARAVSTREAAYAWNNIRGAIRACRSSASGCSNASGQSWGYDSHISRSIIDGAASYFSRKYLIRPMCKITSSTQGSARVLHQTCSHVRTTAS